MDLRRLFDDLVRFETDLWNGVDARLQQDCGVTLGTLNVLLVIQTQTPCRVNDIATALSITVGGASQAVDRLERSHLCNRRPNPADRRSSVVELTEDGRTAITNAGPVFDAELTTWFTGGLDDASLQALGSAMSTLRRVAGANKRNE
jgi:DNA-binding MarR family transcriptional regulator